MIHRLVVTGYKAFELGIFNDDHPGVPIIKKALRDMFVDLITNEQLEWVIVSGQLGVELWATEVVREMKQDYPMLKYAVLPPFEGQAEKWNEKNQQNYMLMVQEADFSTALTKRPYEGPWQFQVRDEFLFKNSDGILFVYDEDNEGSPKFMKRSAEKYAKETPYEVLTITALDLQWIAEEIERERWEGEGFY